MSVSSNNEERNLFASKKFQEFYSRYLYSLIPSVYREHDKDKVLKSFLEIIGEQAANIRQDTKDLLNNFFIDTCQEWVIPYIGELLGTKALTNMPPAMARRDIKKTMQWRKKKGTLACLHDIATTLSERHCEVKESLEWCSCSKNLSYPSAHLKIKEFPDISNKKLLENLATQSTLPHLIDLRHPTGSEGWYNLKNIMIFISQLRAHYHITDSEVETEDKYHYYFKSFLRKGPLSSTLNRFRLYDSETGLPISRIGFCEDPYSFFGSERGMSVRIKGILAATTTAPVCSEMPYKNDPEKHLVTILPTEERKLAEAAAAEEEGEGGEEETNKLSFDFADLDETEGIRLIEPRKFEHPNKQFIIRLYAYFDDYGLFEIASLDTFSRRFSRYRGKQMGKEKKRIHKKTEAGKLVLSVELGEITFPSEFPETVIAIRDSRRGFINRNNEIKDSVVSKYANALYVYLPKIVLVPDYISGAKRAYFFIDNDGSTYFASNKNDNENDNDVHFDKGKSRLELSSLARQSCGQIYPPVLLSYSLQPVEGFSELNRFDGLSLADPSQFVSRGRKQKQQQPRFVIEAYGKSKKQNQTFKIGELRIGSESTVYVNSQEIWLQFLITSSSSSSGQESKRLVSHFKADRTNLQILTTETEIKSLVMTELKKDKVLTDLIEKEKLRLLSVTTRRSIRKDLVEANVSEFDVSMSINFTGEEQEDDDYYSYYHKDNDDDDDNDNSYHRNNHQFNRVFSRIREVIEADNSVFRQDGTVVLQISCPKGMHSEVFPLSEIILRNNSNKRLLVYLPQISFHGGRSEQKTLSIGSDGSTFYAFNLRQDKSESDVKDAANPEHMMQQLLNTSVLSLFTSDKLARRSAGQVMPIPNRVPLQHRTPIYLNLGNWNWSHKVHRGELAIDPDNGRFAFSEDDDYNNNNMSSITVDYNIAMPHEFGSGIYDRRVSLANAKPTKWVSKSGHVHYSEALPSKTFRTVGEALSSLEEDGDVIQIEDNSLYEENAINAILDENISTIEIRAANKVMPTIKLKNYSDGNGLGIAADDDIGNRVNGKMKFDCKNVDHLILNGILVTGGPLTIHGKFKKLHIISCTFDPGTTGSGRFSGVEIMSSSTSSHKSKTLQKDEGPNEILLSKAITGKIVLPNTNCTLIVEDSVIDNYDGVALDANSSRSTSHLPNRYSLGIVLKATRSDILGSISKNITIKELCASDVIFASMAGVGRDQEELEIEIKSCIRHTRFIDRVRLVEDKSQKREQSKNNNNHTMYRCTTAKPIFVSTNFGDPCYLLLDNNTTSKSILEGGENELEMGICNKLLWPLVKRNMLLRLQEYAPVGVKIGIVTLY